VNNIPQHHKTGNPEDWGELKQLEWSKYSSEGGPWEKRRASGSEVWRASPPLKILIGSGVLAYLLSLFASHYCSIGEIMLLCCCMQY